MEKGGPVHVLGGIGRKKILTKIIEICSSFAISGSSLKICTDSTLMAGLKCSLMLSFVISFLSYSNTVISC